jgi:hypothetical protein
VFGIATDISERKDGDGRLLRQRKRIVDLAFRLGLWFPGFHGCDPAHALSGKRAHKFLLVAAVADGPAHRVNAAGQGRFRDDAAAPDRFNQIVLADDAIAIRDEINQNVENLRLDRDNGAAQAQFTALAVEREILE